MHRHGYKGRKFHRERDQREALIQSLAEALIINESIETTLPKAKEIVPFMEKLITKAKKGDLHNRRLIISSLQTVASAHKLVDDIAPKLLGRDSGHLRIEQTRNRRGDNAQLARVSFVDDLSESPVSKHVVTKSATKVAAKKTATAKTTKKAVKTVDAKDTK
jgi:large subunit ribosomal protein L17